MEIVVQGKRITLNEDQVAALKDIKEFLTDKYSLFLSVEGAAGTGKSTLIKEAIKGLISVAVTAPTHKAKKVVSKFTGRRAVTLHSLLGLKPDMSLELFDKHNVLFAQIGASKMVSFKVTVIDESSMINGGLYEMITDTAKACLSKVIFLGDPYQLSPVKQKKERQKEIELSPVFTDPAIKHIRLTKVERQKDSNPLMFVYDAIRSDIDAPLDQFQRQTHIRGDEGIRFYSNPPEFAEQLLHVFRDNSISTNPAIAKMLCWQNDAVRRWNNYLRMNLYGSYKEPLHSGEVIMAYRNIYGENEESGLLVQNSAEYLVLAVKGGNNEGINGWHIDIEDIDAANPITKTVFVVAPDMSNYIRFVEREQQYLNKAKQAPAERRSWYWKQYYTFRNQYLLLENILDNNNNILVARDFDYAYALTVHKSQGSSYRYVFVDEKDIDQNSCHPERNRLKYVGFSRPTNIAHVLNY